MIYLVLAVIAVIVLLAAGLAISVKAAQTRGRKVKELEASLESARNETRRQGEYQKKREEAQQNADAKKEALRTGNDAADFNNSINVLNSAGKIEAVDPALSFPYFPDPLDGEGRPIPVLDGQSVTVPLWYWLGITEYVIEVEKTREVYNAWREIYLAEEK